ncbi:MAG TPA: transglutaminase family protein, partial [Dehalococcoidia bacterium]|nr:transglutaminase family protein [Dehalococcoidia bacterium]
AITYQFGVTGVQTPAAMALHLGRGVCQDYSHILLCLLRLLGIPARYVSGHLLGEGAPHAWVEALIAAPAAPDGYSVVPYDPTNRRRAGINYLTVAIGRDYADVAPTSGCFSGGAQGKLSSSKHAEIVEIEYGDAADEEAA